jgi:serine/threonine-protein kinase CHEK2
MCIWIIFPNRARLQKGSLPENETESKKPRRSGRNAGKDGPDKTPVSQVGNLPSPVTNPAEEESYELRKEPTATPPGGRPSQVPHREPEDMSQAVAFSSPVQDTQLNTQPAEQMAALSAEVEDEVKEGVWGYLLPLDTRYGGRCVVLKKRTACPLQESVSDAVGAADVKGKSPLRQQEEAFERTKIKGIASGGYLIGRHIECGTFGHPDVSLNLHSDLLQIS